MSTFVRRLFTTVRGVFTLIGILGGIAFAIVAFLLITGGPERGERVVLGPKDEIDTPFDLGLDPLAGGEIGLVYEAYLSPQQEGEEEDDAPGILEEFQSTEPSVEREERPSRAHGTVAFNREMSRAFVHLEIANIDPNDIVMAHIHCGRPSQLGPIMLDFGATGSLPEYFADNVLSYEITNDDIKAATQGHGITSIGTAGCPVIKTIPGDKFTTIAGMATIAAEGELYFNIHTAQQTFFGDIRGQLVPVDPAIVEAVLTGE